MATSHIFTALTLQEQQILLEEEQKLNSILGLQIPQGVLTEHISLWQRFFSLIRLMYTAGLIRAEESPQLVDYFEHIPNSQKDDYLVFMGKTISDKLDQNSLLEEIYLQTMLDLEVSRLYNILPLPIRDRVLDYLLNGQNLPLDLEEQMNQTLSEAGEEEILIRLQNALDKRKTLDARKLGKTMSPEDVVNRFNLDEPQTASNSVNVPNQEIGVQGISFNKNMLPSAGSPAQNPGRPVPKPLTPKPLPPTGSMVQPQGKIPQAPFMFQNTTLPKGLRPAPNPQVQLPRPISQPIIPTGSAGLPNNRSSQPVNMNHLPPNIPNQNSIPRQNAN